MLYAVFYETAADGLAKVPEVMPGHREHWRRFLADGTLKLIGPFNPPSHGALGIFTTREAAEDFATHDPFVLHGVVARWRLEEWMEAVGSD